MKPESHTEKVSPRDSLAEAVPVPEPAEGALTSVLKGGLSLLPGGGVLTELIDYGLATRTEQQRHDFDMKLAKAVDALVARLDGAVTREQILRSDDFLAALHETWEAATKTRSVAKRKRLAAATAEAGPWSDFAQFERDRFVAFVAKYDDLHVWLLAYFADPVAWLDAHGMSHVYEDRHTDEIGAQIAEAFGLGTAGERVADDVPEAVQDAIADLASDSLISPIVLDSIRDNVYASQTTNRGHRFLAFVRELEPALMPAPTEDVL